MLQIYSLKDIKNKLFGIPMYFHDDEHCKHDMTLFFIPNNIEKIDPSNYDIYRVGTFDEKTGKITRHNKQSVLANCQKLLNIHDKETARKNKLIQDQEAELQKVQLEQHLKQIELNKQEEALALSEKEI